LPRTPFRSKESPFVPEGAAYTVYGVHGDETTLYIARYVCMGMCVCGGGGGARRDAAGETRETFLRRCCPVHDDRIIRAVLRFCQVTPEKNHGPGFCAGKRIESKRRRLPKAADT
jgi:hypothetical protein